MPSLEELRLSLLLLERKWTSVALAITCLGLLQSVHLPIFGALQGTGQRTGITVQMDELLTKGKVAEADSAVKQYLQGRSPSAELLAEIGRVYFEHDQWKQGSEL